MRPMAEESHHLCRGRSTSTADPSFASRDNACGNAYRNRVRRYGPKHDGVSADRDIVSNGNNTKNLCACSNIDAVAKNRGTAFLCILESDRDSVANNAIFAKATVT